MCLGATAPNGQRLSWANRRLRLVLAALAVCAPAVAQSVPGLSPQAKPEWRHIGNSGIEMSLAAPASGPVDRVWFSGDGVRAYVRTLAGKVFETSDFEAWKPSPADPPARNPGLIPGPAGTITVQAGAPQAGKLYAFGGNVLRSDDGGFSWTNVTDFQGQSIIGGRVRDLAVSPANPDEILVANDTGAWRSLDGGMSWAGLNETLPNLPVLRLSALPRAAAGVRLAGPDGVIEWAPGEKLAWRVISDGAADAAGRAALADALGVAVTALESAGDFRYAGSADGRLWVSAGAGGAWTATPADRGPVESIWVDPGDPRLALAALDGKGPRVLRTFDGGRTWDDLTADLPEGGAHGIAADRASGSVYVATDSGVFSMAVNLDAAAPPTTWTKLPGLPAARALDVRLDAGANQLYVALEGYGVYAAMAPHRLRALKVVNAADFSQRPAAPGSLLSVLGGWVQAASAGALSMPVLAASDTETQIQVPFSASGSSLSLALRTTRGDLRVAVPLESVSPAIFVDRDGTPLVLDADSGVLLDAMNPARSGGRLQILATGLGKVNPDWLAGVAGPADNPPVVVAPVQAYLDRSAVEVTRAVLAPGYVGLYLIEVRLPVAVNVGTAEFYLDAGGQSSNRVRVWLEP
jgi:uncharacterized protein (TIGR03437 family)